MMWIRWSGAMLGAVFLAACGKESFSSPASANAPTVQRPAPLTNLPTVKLWLGARELEAELFVTREQINTGLTGRPAIHDDQLMLFAFRNSGPAGFYMTNVLFDIDVAYLTPEGTIFEIAHLKAGDPTGDAAKSNGIQFLAVASPGWFEKNRLRPGGLVRTPQGLLREVIGPRAQVPYPTRWEPTHALTNLPTTRLLVGERELDAELCVTREEISTGLMFRKEIRDDQLMLFLFRDSDHASFYMKNVPFDIDVGYLASDGTISEVVRLKARDEVGVLSKSGDIRFVLEAAPDWFKKNNLRPGSLIRTPQGSLDEVLGPKAQVSHNLD